MVAALGDMTDRLVLIATRRHWNGSLVMPTKCYLNGPLVLRAARR